MELEVLRRDESSWSLLAFAPSGEGENWEDDNFQARFRVVISLQYHCTPNDLRFLKYLFEQEIQYHLEAPFQGVTETLEILGWLLAKERSLDNIPLFIEAKLANFDTSCGFDIEHVFSAGVEETLAYLRALAVEDSDEEYILNKYKPAQESIDRWFEKQRKKYPLNPEEETLETQVRRHFLLGELEEPVMLLPGGYAITGTQHATRV